MNIKLFESLRYHEECLNLDQEIINTINNSFLTYKNFSQKGFKNQNIKKTVTVLKNPKIQIIKDKIPNKINLILNKLSENNMNNLIFEFIENIKILNIENYNEFLKTIYIKILSEVNFIKNYLNFFIAITNTYNHYYNYDTRYFINLIELKFKYEYEKIELEDDYLFLVELNHNNNLKLINELIKLNYFDNNFKIFIEHYIINQKIYLSDIWDWFKDTKLNEEQTNKIKIILKDEIQLRDKVLLENLINDNNKIIFKNPNIILTKEKSEEKVNKKIDENIELDNIVEEYLFINNSESIEYYIETNCKEAISKNKLCEYLINYYLKDIDDYEKILKLFKNLIKIKLLFKSNLSRGLLNVYNNKLNQDKIKKLLIFLKNLGITSGLENLINKYI
jgi:hypothetical protein